MDFFFIIPPPRHERDDVLFPRPDDLPVAVEHLRHLILLVGAVARAVSVGSDGVVPGRQRRRLVYPYLFFRFIKTLLLPSK